MLRWVLVLVLTAWVGVGLMGDRPSCSCADDCSDDGGAGGAEHGATGADLGCQESGPCCVGCPRLAVDTAPRLALAPVRVETALVPADPPARPPASPPLSGLFRPPRA